MGGPFSNTDATQLTNFRGTQTVTFDTGTKIFTLVNSYIVQAKKEDKKEKIKRIAKERLKASHVVYNEPKPKFKKVFKAPVMSRGRR